MTKGTLAETNYVLASSRSSRRANTLLAQMADLERAERIKTLREDRGLTQPAVAEAVDVTLRAYQAWEATGGVREGNAKKLAAYYGVGYQWLWAGREKPAETPDLMGQVNGNGHPPADELADIRARLERIERNQRHAFDKLDRLMAAIGLEDESADLNSAVDAFARALEARAEGGEAEASTG